MYICLLYSEDQYYNISDIFSLIILYCINEVHVFWQLNETPLHAASRGGKLKVIQLLFDKGASIDEVDEVSDITSHIL